MPEKLQHASLVTTLVRINLRVMTFQIAVGQSCRRAVTWPGNIDHVQVVLLDQTVQVNPHQGLAGIRTPVPEQPVLDVFALERLAKQRIRPKINHSRRQVIASPPIGIHFSKLIGRERGRDFRFFSHDVLQKLL